MGKQYAFYIFILLEASGLLDHQLLTVHYHNLTVEWRNKFVPHIWSGSDSEAAVAKGLPPTNPDVRENVLLYRYDLKVSKKEPLRRLLISKGHFFSRTPCSFCSSKVVWIG